MLTQVNYEVKGQLAKLLATEDLIIENRKVSTASFDTERRVLTLPMWEKASGVVYDLLVGHEVGHALHTPADNWTIDYPDVPMSYVNVLEDVRIEKFMKQRYPGLSKTFYNGYSQLAEQDFFELDQHDLNDMGLADRINIHYKIGKFEKVSFESDEEYFVNQASKTETFQDVLDLARELYEWAESKQAEKEEEMDIPVPQNADGGERESNGNDDGKSEGGEKEETDQDPDQEIINPTQPWDSSDNPLEDLSEGLGQQQQKQDTSGIGGDSYDASNLDTELVDELFDDVDETDEVVDEL